MATYTVANGHLTMHQALAAAAKNPGADVIDVQKDKVSPFVVKDGSVTIRGNGAEIDASRSTYGIVVEAPWVRVSGFEIHGSNGGAVVVQNHHATVSDMEIRDGFGSGIVVMRTDYATIIRNYVHDLNGPKVIAGITVWQPIEVTGYADLWARIKIIGNTVEGIHQGGPEGFTVILDYNPMPKPYDHRAIVEDNHGSDSDKGMMAFGSDDFVFRDNVSEDVNKGGAYRFRDSAGLVENNMAIGPLGYAEIGTHNDITYHGNEHIGVQEQMVDWLWFH